MREVLIGTLIASMVATLLAWWRIPTPRPPLFRLLGLLSALGLATELLGLILERLAGNNAYLYNCYLTAEALLVPTMVYTLRPQWRKWLIGAGVLAVGALAWNATRQDFSTMLFTEGALVGALVFAFLSISLLWHLANTSDTPLQRLPAFWVFMGLLVYFGGLLPVVGSALMIYVRNMDLSRILWGIIPLLAVVRYLLAAYACLLQARKVRNDHG